MNIGDALRLSRTRLGLTIAQVAEKTGLSTSHISMVERGERDPTYSTVERMARALEIPMSLLVFMASDPPTEKGIDSEIYGRLSTLTMQLLMEQGNRNAAIQRTDI